MVTLQRPYQFKIKREDITRADPWLHIYIYIFMITASWLFAICLIQTPNQVMWNMWWRQTHLCQHHSSSSSRYYNCLHKIDSRIVRTALVPYWEWSKETVYQVWLNLLGERSQYSKTTHANIDAEWDIRWERSKDGLPGSVPLTVQNERCRKDIGTCMYLSRYVIILYFKCFIISNF